MSNVTSDLTINDGQSTPVARTFEILNVSPAESQFAWKTGSATAAGWKLLRLLFSQATTKRKTYRVSVESTYPVESIDGNGNITVSDIGLAKTTFVVPSAFTAAQRSDLHAIHKNALEQANIKAAIKDLSPAY